LVLVKFLGGATFNLGRRFARSEERIPNKQYRERGFINSRLREIRSLPLAVLFVWYSPLASKEKAAPGLAARLSFEFE
jgi:hypothetical protein